MNCTKFINKFLFVTLFLIVGLLSGCSINQANRPFKPLQPEFSRENAVRLYMEVLTFKNSGRYYEARNLLQQTVAHWLLENPPASSYKRKLFYNLLSGFVYELGYLYALDNDIPAITRLTEQILAIPDKEKQYLLIKDGLSLVHLSHTGDLKQFRKIMARAQTLIGQFKSEDDRPESISDFDLLTDPFIIKGMLGYVALEDGKTIDIYHTQKELESLYDEWFIQLGLLTSETLGLFPDFRTLALGLGAYGYGMLGMHVKSEMFFQKSMEAMDSEWSSMPYLQGYVHLAYADASLIPLDHFEEATYHINKGVRLINSVAKTESLQNQLGIIVSPYIRAVRHYPGVVQLKLIAQRPYSKDAELAPKLAAHLFSVSKSENPAESTALDSATPKIFVADAIYYTAKIVREPYLLRPMIEQAHRLLARYEGIQLWKLYYAESLLHDKEGNLKAALQSAKNAVEILERYAATPFPDLRQQATFWTDKETAYRRVVELLMQVHGRNPSEVASELLYYASVSKTRVNLSDYHAFMSSRNPGPEGLLPTLQSHLSEGAALIDFWYYGNKLLVIAAKRNAPPFVSITDINSEDNIKAEVNKFRQTMKDKPGLGEANDDDLIPGNKLYAVLLQEALEKLDDVKRLYISPHRELHMLPWNALSVNRNPGDGRFLVDRYTTVIIPSALSVPLNAFQNLGNLPKDDEITVAIGSETMFPEELENEIKINCNNCNIIPPQSLSSDVLAKEMKNSRALFVYAHGEFKDENPMDSYFHISKSLTGDDRLYFREIQELSHTSDFIFLANCQLGEVGRQGENNGNVHNLSKQNYPEGEQLVGAYKMLFARGTHAAAVCLNNVPESTTSKLAKQMLGEARHAGDYADIFHAAVSNTKSTESDPYYWGWCNLIIGGATDDKNTK
jgi:hypothetical protein